ncbi:hypothetical protein NB311A_18301 [Nitrobacter sp. Nb-311A]|nr:hypothetical protein NB311A_18301 [Nitrobacter sp. Nb-311A]
MLEKRHTASRRTKSPSIRIFDDAMANWQRDNDGRGVCNRVCCAVATCRGAGAMLIAQDDPARLADLQLDSALRIDPALVGRNIEAALAAHDPDLASSFVDLAAAKGISIPEDRSQRVTEAAGQENSTSGVAPPPP